MCLCVWGEGGTDSESVPKGALSFLVKLKNTVEKVKRGKNCASFYIQRILNECSCFIKFI